MQYSAPQCREVLFSKLIRTVVNIKPFVDQITCLNLQKIIKINLQFLCYVGPNKPETFMGKLTKTILYISISLTCIINFYRTYLLTLNL